jgi:hypothetical protein
MAPSNIQITLSGLGPLNAFYDSEINRIKTAHPELDTDQLHPFVAFTGGNFDHAAELYTDWIDRKQADLGKGWGA